MKHLFYNAVAILLVLLASYMVYADKPYYGWVIVAAIVCIDLHGIQKRHQMKKMNKIKTFFNF